MATFKRQVKDYRSSDIRQHMVADGNGCVAIAVARAMADDPDDLEEVSVLAALVEGELIQTGSMTERGVHYGDCIRAIELTERPFEIVEAVPGKMWTSYKRRQKLPTAAQFLRSHPNITEAVVRCTSHLAYYREGVSYSLGARKRVDVAYVFTDNGSNQ